MAFCHVTFTLALLVGANAFQIPSTLTPFAHSHFFKSKCARVVDHRIPALNMLVGAPKQVLVTGASGKTGFAVFEVCLTICICGNTLL